MWIPVVNWSEVLSNCYVTVAGCCKSEREYGDHSGRSTISTVEAMVKIMTAGNESGPRMI
jgi:hypothetical protein